MKNLHRPSRPASFSLATLLAIGAFCLTLVPASRVEAALNVAPNSAATVEGNSANDFPFGIGADATSQRYQQLYSGSFFSAVPVTGAYITDLSFRLNGFGSFGFSTTLPSIRIDLETTSIADDSLSTTFAANVNGSDTIVYGGNSGSSLTLASGGPNGGLNDFTVTIHLANPYFYIPTLGSLLLDVRNFGGGQGTLLDAVSTAGDGVSRVCTDYRGTVYSTTATVADTLGLVTAFTTSPVPEPSTWSMLLGGLCLLGAAGYARRTGRA